MCGVLAACVCCVIGCGESTDDSGGPDSSHEAIALQGPSYRGSVSNGPACDAAYPTSGHAPADAGRYPLFLYFVGTEFVPGIPSNAHDNPAAMAVTEAMARRGFVALSVDYDNDVAAWLSDHQNQLACLFDAQRPESLIAKACGLSSVDCERGVATWGHSQGGLVAVVAHDRDPRVRAAWATGYGGDGDASLDRTRLRVVNGEADAADNGTAAKLQSITGLSAAECPDPDQCLRRDGSGYIIVRASQLENPAADAGHCWFDRATCSGNLILEPTWVDPASDRPYAIAPNADWLASAATR
jgi:hypothetical protein